MVPVKMSNEDAINLTELDVGSQKLVLQDERQQRVRNIASQNSSMLNRARKLCWSTAFLPTCVPSPQSNSQTEPVGKRIANAETFLVVDGACEAVPKNTMSMLPDVDSGRH